MPYVRAAVAGRARARGRWVLAVAGTHGKTTTTSLLAWILRMPVSARLPDRRRAATSACPRAWRTPFFVIEADEYDTGVLRQALEVRALPAAHRDPQQSRVSTTPTSSPTSRDRDPVPPSGAHGPERAAASSPTPTEDSLKRVIARLLVGAGMVRRRRLDGRGTGADRAEAGFRLDGARAWHDGRSPAATTSDALAAIAAAPRRRHARRRSPALGRFAGIKRRLELRGTVSGVSVYDDFAHHPTAIALTIDGLRRRGGPQGASWRCSSRGRTP